MNEEKKSIAEEYYQYITEESSTPIDDFEEMYDQLPQEAKDRIKETLTLVKD